MHIHPSTCLSGPLFARRARKDTTIDTTGSFDRNEAPAEDDDPTFRADLVARLRRQIAEGTYGTDEQLQIALERMLQRMDKTPE
jgi:hypothetical protein